MTTAKTTNKLTRHSLAFVGLTAIGLSTPQVATAATFTLGGFTWDEANSVTTAEVVEGSMDFERAFINDFGQGLPGFDVSKSVGQLLGHNPNPNYSSSVPFPDAGGDGAPPLPNVDRATIELTWGGLALPNLEGDDFVIYEVGTQEGYSVSVQKVGETTFTTKRYEFVDSADTTADLFTTAFDLNDFGLGYGDFISAIQITNLFNSQAAAPDLVDNSSGEGNVLSPDSPDYASGFTLKSSPSEGEYATENLDADIIYVAGLHNVAEAPEGETVPEPASVLGLLVFGAFGAGSLIKRKPRQ